MTRVIAGEYGGRRLKTVKGAKTRSTSARVRESLFSILGARTAGSRFADLYAGAGIVGVEALSRGAASCTFVERARGPATVLRSNLDTLGVGPTANVRVMTVDRWLRDTLETFDIMFLDPPYEYDNIGEILAGIGHAGLIDPAGLLVLEHAGRSDPPQPENCFGLTRTQKYGDSALSFYRPAPGG